MKHFFRSLKVPETEVVSIKTNLSTEKIVSKISSLIKEPFTIASVSRSKESLFKGNVNRDGFEIYLIRDSIGQSFAVDGLMPQLKARLSETGQTVVKVNIGYSNQTKVLAPMLTWFVRLFMFGWLLMPSLGLFFSYKETMQSNLITESPFFGVSFSGFLSSLIGSPNLLLLIMLLLGPIFILHFTFINLPSSIMKRGAKRSKQILLSILESN